MLNELIHSFIHFVPILYGAHHLSLRKGTVGTRKCQVAPEIGFSLSPRLAPFLLVIPKNTDKFDGHLAPV